MSGIISDFYFFLLLIFIFKVSNDEFEYEEQPISAAIRKTFLLLFW